jgi:heavy metal translocating P-type ATPase
MSEEQIGKDTSEDLGEGIRWTELARIVFVLFAAASVWWRIGEAHGALSIIGLVAALVGGYPIFREAMEAILERRMTMELSMTIAIIAALVISEFFTALIIIVFVLVAEILEGLTVARGRHAIRDLLHLLPSIAMVRRGDKPRELRSEELRVGDVVFIKPGARIPVDGVVVHGHSFVDQSPITGESLPVEKLSGAPVYAGTINQSGILEVCTERIGRDTAFGRIIEAVEQAERSRAPIQKIADRLAGYLVYFALGCAILTFVLTRDPRSTISVVIVAGACGIAAGTPLAILGGIGLAARHGAIIKGGRYLEAMWAAGIVVLDKTGTLTFGTPEVTDIRPEPNVSAEKLLEVAVTAERASEHPIGRAIVNKAAVLSIASSEPEQFRYHPGKGIRCAVGTEEIVVGNRAFFEELGIGMKESSNGRAGSSDVYVACNGRLFGTIQVADTLRPEAIDAVAELKSMGLRTLLLTGDNHAIASTVGKALGVDEVGGGLLPEEKMIRVQKLTREDSGVIMVGDGINDAPALMQATVGVAMGSGTDVARETANVVLLGNNLLDFVKSLQIARRVRRIILTNFVGTLVVDGTGVLLAAFGFLKPLLAAFIHVSSELAFILNSARLLPSKTRVGGGVPLPPRASKEGS